MITLSDTFLALLPTPFDSKMCNFYYSGSNIIIETLAQYKTRVSTNYRVPGMIIAVLLPKIGYTLLSSYPMNTFSTILSNFDYKYYTYSGGVADGDFIELVLADISTLVVKDGDKVLSDNNFSDADKAKLDAYKPNPTTISLPGYASVATRCLNAVSGVDYPTGWTLQADVNPNDLLITHNLGRSTCVVTVFSVDGAGERQLYANAAFSGIVSKPLNNALVIEGLATISAQIKIYIIFS